MRKEGRAITAREQLAATASPGGSGSPGRAGTGTTTDPAALELLKARYFGPAPAVDNLTEVEFFIDGQRYYEDLDRELDLLGPGDRLYVLDWYHQPFWDIRDRQPGDAGHRPIGERFAQKAHAGVDVRIILSGGNYWTMTTVPPFFNEYQALRELTSLVPAGADQPPLADRVLFDWSGADVTGTHHQKVLVLVRGDQMAAYVSGMGLNDAGADSAPHTSRECGDPPWVWGWHDAAAKLTGGAAVLAYENFAERWEEASTLPASKVWLRASLESLRPIQRVRHVPPRTSAVPPAPRPAPAPGALPETSVQVLRSRYPTKINLPLRRPVPWRTAGGGGVFEVYDTLRTAIGAARRYIYLEDQFNADHPIASSRFLQWIIDHSDWMIDRRIPRYSLFPHLADAVRRGVRIVVVGSGHSDPRDIFPGEQNETLNRQLARLAAIRPDAVAVWRLLQVTVHSKIMLIDDEFAAIGSANLAARSMMGVDSELHVAMVTTGPAVRRLRARLWAEYLGLDYDRVPADLACALDDETDALGMWRTAWTTGNRWFTAGDPSGFEPARLMPGVPRTRMVRAYVGPGPTP
ncbi:MAG TPA: phospholipase D-like domain-containing protein [Micromonosporaceae bacterium]